MKLFCPAMLVAVLLCETVQADLPSAPIGLSEAFLVEAQSSGHTATLRETLITGLKATRDDQKRFIDLIVLSVEQEKLPVSLVYAALRWAQKRRRDYPFPYFKYAILAMAKQKHIVL